MTAATFATAALIGWAGAALARGWYTAAREHRREYARRYWAEYDLTIAQNLIDGQARALEYAIGRIADRNRHIAELEPLTDVGRRLRARRRGQDAARKVARAAGRGL